MKVGLYFGSFNPIHTGHLIIANFVAGYPGIQQVWLIVSPQNPHKPSSTLLNEHHRLNLARLATEDNRRIKVSAIEFKLPRPSFTIDTLAYLKEQNPQDEFMVIVGSDSYQNIRKWKNHETLLKNNEFIIYERPGFPVEYNPLNSPVILSAPLLDISSSLIREFLTTGRSIQYLVPEIVRQEIDNQGYYRELKKPAQQ